MALVIEKFLGLFDNPNMRTVHDLIEFNKEHASQELPPGMSNLVFRSSNSDPETYRSTKPERVGKRTED